MNITSNDIKKRDFKKSLRGFDQNEVDAFLDTVSLHYEKLVAENKVQADRIKSLLSDIDIYKENEMNLQKAIIKSQDLGEEIIENAKKKAENIIKEADLNARHLKQNLEDDILDKRHELEEIKSKNDKLMEEIRVFLSDKLNELEDFMRNKKIYKMELANINQYNEQEEHHEPDNEKVEEKKTLKKVYISNQPGNNDKKSFDDSFELK
ncbi:DivIVA domain-containing protein [bacterium]|nr:MAG: DivIVA domain-containing protein [bacterium]